MDEFIDNADGNISLGLKYNYRSIKHRGCWVIYDIRDLISTLRD